MIGVGNNVWQRGCVNVARFLVRAAKDALQEQYTRPVDGTGEIYMDRATMMVSSGAGTAKFTSGGGGKLCGQEVADQRETLSHFLIFPEGQPFSLVLVGSTAMIILTHRDLVAVTRIIETYILEEQWSD